MLSNKQQQVIQYWVYHPYESYQGIADNFKIDQKTFYNWRQDDEFMNYYHTVCEKKFRSMESMAVDKMTELAANGNYNAIKYLLDYKGYKPEEKVSVDNKTEFSIKVDEV